MTDQHQLVIPGPDSFGFRVNARTPLALLIGILRRHNPDVPFAHIKLAAERLRSGARPMGDQGSRPEPFNSATGPTAVPSAPASGDARAVGPAVAEPGLARLDEIETGKIKRAEAAAWAQANGYDVPAKGFLPGAVVAAYRAAMRDEYLASLVPVVNAEGMPAEPMPAEAPATKVH